MIYKNGQGKEYYYFTPVKGSFGGAQICDVWGGAIEKLQFYGKKQMVLPILLSMI